MSNNHAAAGNDEESHLPKSYLTLKKFASERGLKLPKRLGEKEASKG